MAWSALKLMSTVISHAQPRLRKDAPPLMQFAGSPPDMTRTDDLRPCSEQARCITQKGENTAFVELRDLCGYIRRDDCRPTAPSLHRYRIVEISRRRLVRGPTSNGCRARARAEPNDQKQNKYCDRPNSDALQKSEETVPQAHASIMEFAEGWGDITKMLALLFTLMPAALSNCVAFRCRQFLSFFPAACPAFASAPGGLRKIAGTLWFFIMSFRATRSLDLVLLHWAISG